MVDSINSVLFINSLCCIFPHLLQ
uniref:Uncharacterized protein n=1 Tax=Anguilla anguilla TaxID=7936 RepID=A0A0E9RI12_ANGAN